MKKIDGMPDAGPERFWVGHHQPSNTKLPLLLELREKTISSAKINVSFSRLITKQGTIADEKAIIATAEEMLARASRVDEFTGIYEVKS